MIPQSTDSRAFKKDMIRAIFLIPPLVTGVLFLVLYNNLYLGRLIMIILVVFNGAILAMPETWRPAARALSYAKQGAGCTIAALGTLLFLEIAFPVFLPQEYARIRDLSKGVRRASAEDLRRFSVVFTNGADEAWRKLAVRKGRNDVATSFKAPGEQFEYFGYEPNEKYKYVNVIRWNSRGYFDNDYDYVKKPGTYRIVLIGDSFVEALQVPLARSFHKLLENSLNRLVCGPRGPRRFEVIALGNSGTGLKNHLRVLEEEAIHYNPDAVAVTLYGNDSSDDDPGLNRERTLAAGEITPSVRGLARHGYLALAFALDRYNKRRMRDIAISPELLQWSAGDIPRIESARTFTFERVKAARDFCRSRGIQFVLIYISSELEVKYRLDPDGTMDRLTTIPGFDRASSWDMAKSVKLVGRYCREHRIPLISLLEPLAAAQRETGRLVYGDHFSFFGHEVVARAIEEGLRAVIFKDCAQAASPAP